MTYEELISYYKKNDKLIYLSILTLKKMNGSAPEKYAEEILRFIEHRKIYSPLELYSRRVKTLGELQNNFEKEKVFRQSSYNEIQPVDDELYKLSLLISFIVTNHRFKILKQLDEFLESPPKDNIKLLIIGFGTGYEVKLAIDRSKKSLITAYDNSEASFVYAKDLLRFFSCPLDSLRFDTFLLEDDMGMKEFEEIYDKIIMCEVMEHLEKPESALKNLKRALKKGGKLFVTMAVNIAQEDHVYLYSSHEQAKHQVLEAGFQIEKETFTPVVVLPFEEKDRFWVSNKGNYICTAVK
jgi:SAM-dependent methyltransferase